MPATDAEMIAWRLGEEMAANPDQQLQAPDRPWEIGEIPMSEERQQAMRNLGPEVFFGWAERGWNAAEAAAAKG